MPLPLNVRPLDGKAASECKVTLTEEEEEEERGQRSDGIIGANRGHCYL